MLTGGCEETLDTANGRKYTHKQETKGGPTTSPPTQRIHVQHDEVTKRLVYSKSCEIVAS